MGNEFGEECLKRRNCGVWIERTVMMRKKKVGFEMSALGKDWVLNEWNMGGYGYNVFSRSAVAVQIATVWIMRSTELGYSPVPMLDWNLMLLSRFISYTTIFAILDGALIFRQIGREDIQMGPIPQDTIKLHKFRSTRLLNTWLYRIY